jgi:hypothetical protein
MSTSLISIANLMSGVAVYSDEYWVTCTFTLIRQPYYIAYIAEYMFFVF